jgi:hypothetical protein
VIPFGGDGGDQVGERDVVGFGPAAADELAGPEPIDPDVVGVRNRCVQAVFDEGQMVAPDVRDVGIGLTEVGEEQEDLLQ